MNYHSKVLIASRFEDDLTSVQDVLDLVDRLEDYHPETTEFTLKAICLYKRQSTEIKYYLENTKGELLYYVYHETDDDLWWSWDNYTQEQMETSIKAQYYNSELSFIEYNSLIIK